ncbi:hypothetical protein PPEV_gp165 [Pseudomonas phage EL]|uniref:Uncharacterized protein n=1 Tax=Pseudomonas phage EL TaxID=273133 RepID=Q2Z0R6_9CAUD|nr:hypothetical protein PPEV_gp165 [Pseudomonas phage EL]CAG27259.1 hypothetical protein [Pseudomonas phage EL]
MEQQANTVEYEDELMDGVPEMEHIEQVLDGLSDTVMGTEGMDLTANQRYLQSVLHTAGYLTRNEVAGNEGFLSSIGEGIKKAWEYIKNLFKSIFGGLFKKNVKDKLDKVDESAKAAEKAIDAVASPKVTTTNVGPVLQEATQIANKIEDQSAKETVVKKLDDIKALPVEHQPEQVKKVIKEVFDSRIIHSSLMRSQVAKLEAAVGRLNERKAKYQKLADEGEDSGVADGMVIGIQQYVNGLIGLPKVTTIKDLNSAKEFVRKIGRCEEAMSNSWVSIFETRQALESKIAKVEGQINHYSNDTDKEALNKRLDELKGLLSGVVEVDKITVTVAATMIDITELVRSSCVTKVK